jgi:hypothetical protein
MWHRISPGGQARDTDTGAYQATGEGGLFALGRPFLLTQKLLGYTDSSFGSAGVIFIARIVPP